MGTFKILLASNHGKYLTSHLVGFTEWANGQNEVTYNQVKNRHMKAMKRYKRIP